MLSNPAEKCTCYKRPFVSVMGAEIPRGEKSEWHSLGLGLILPFTGGTPVPVISVYQEKKE